MAKRKERAIVFTCSNKEITEEQSLDILLKVLQMHYDRALGNQYDNASTN